MLYILQNLTFAFETPKQQQCKQNLTWLDSIHQNYADVENKMKDSYLYFNVFWFLWMWFYLIFELVFGSLYKQYCQIDNCQHRTKGISKQVNRYYDNWQNWTQRIRFDAKKLQAYVSKSVVKAKVDPEFDKRFWRYILFFYTCNFMKYLTHSSYVRGLPYRRK